MNVRRGLFRLWICFAAVCAVLSFHAYYHDVRDGVDKAGTILALTLPDGTIVTGIPDNMTAAALRQRLMTNGLPTDARAAAKLAVLDKFDLEDALAKAPRAPSPWIPVFTMLCYGVGIPLLVLACGIALLWVVAGFRNDVKKVFPAE